MRVIFTSAIIDEYYEERKLEYLDSYNKLLEFFKKDDIFIVECFLNEKSFLEEYQDVFYSNANNVYIRNKGVKEALSLIKFIESNDIDDDEIIIKHTGRYKFISKFLINEINENKNIDLFVREGVNNQYFTGTFAIQYKFFKKFILSLDLNKMEKYMVNIEKELYDFSIRKKLNTKVYCKIDIYSKINNNDEYIW